MEFWGIAEETFSGFSFALLWSALALLWKLENEPVYIIFVHLSPVIIV